MNSHNGKKWSESSEYVFAFETQNEAMHGEVRIYHPPTWSPKVTNWQENSGALQKWQCSMAEAVEKAKKGGKMLIMKE